MKRNVSLSKDKRTGNWIAYFFIDGKTKSWSTRTRSKKDAYGRANKEYDKRISGGGTKHRTTKSGTVSCFIESFKMIAGKGKMIDIKSPTISNCIRVLFAMLNASFTKEVQKERQPLSDKTLDTLGNLDTTVINGILFSNYVAFKLDAMAVTGNPSIDGPKESSIRRSCNSHLTKVKMMFQPLALAAYGHINQTVPGECLDFYNTKKKKVAKCEYKAPKKELVEKVWVRMNQLRVENPQVYVAFILAACGGMRKGEVLMAMVSWIRADFSGLDIPQGITKNGKGRFIPLPVERCKEVYNICTGYIHNDKREAGFLVGRWTGERLNKELAALGFGEKARMHELRKYYGAQIATMANIYVASKLLGHGNITVTTDHYADYLDELKAAPSIDGMIKTSVEPKQLEENAAIEVEAVA